MEDKLLQYDTKTIVWGATAPNIPTIYKSKWSGAHDERLKYIDKNVKGNRFMDKRVSQRDLTTGRSGRGTLWIYLSATRRKRSVFKNYKICHLTL